ncbi:MAG TPA: hypothetical protein VL382_03735, partial [Terriglobales bacterium]|nr:hypothetical protein [Terriglobales bacterium]
NIVREDETLIANTLASSTWSINMFLGSALGGIAAVWLGREAVFTLDSVSFLLSALLLSRMKFVEPHLASRPPARLRDFFDHSEVVEGMRYVRRDRRLVANIFIKGALGVTGASWVIFPILGKDVFPVRGAITPEHGALLGMAFLMGARGLGSLIGPLATAPWAEQHFGRLRAGILAGFAASGLGYIALAWTTDRWFAYTVVVISHMGSAVVWVFSTTLLQLMTEDRFRGRVFAAELAFCTIALAATSFAAGWLMDHGLGVRALAGYTGVLALIAAGWWAVAGTGESTAS